eukprot:6459187-Pyramimonas_sp.AAC.1
MCIRDSRLSHLEKEFDLARAKPREAPITSDDWDRPTDPTIFQIRRASAIPKASVADALQEWLGAANLQLGEHAELLGDDLSRQYAPSFLG